MTEAPHEVELKLRIAATSTDDVLRHPAVLDVKCARARTTRLTSVYFDTPDQRLARAGVALRLRRAGSGWLQTIKGPAVPRSAGGLSERVECEWRIARSTRRPPLDLHKLATTPYRRVIEKATQHGRLAPMFVTRFERTTVPLQFGDGTTAQLCLDRGVVHSGERAGRGVASEPIREVELELGSGRVERLFDLALALAEDLPVSVETRSKAERGYALLVRQPAPAAMAGEIVLDDATTAGEAMAVVVRSCLRHVEGNVEGVRSGDDPEAVHQMRVGIRRLRSALALLRSVVPPRILRSLEDELRWVAALLGSVRDLDVFTLDTLPALTASSERVPDGSVVTAPIDVLDAAARTKASDARDNARLALASSRFARLDLGIARLAHAHLRDAPQDNVEHAVNRKLQMPARAFAAEQLTRRRRTLRRIAGSAIDGTAAQRHELRLQAKKLRYACEFFASLFPTAEVKRHRKAIAKLQKVLGSANDAAVAIGLAADLVPDSPSAALVAGWASARVDGSDNRLARAWRAFAEARPFWKT